VYDTVPVTIEYKLPPHAKTLDKVILEFKELGMLHRKKILGRS
jgi:DNA-binding HxlR family transcriptional regulator